MFHFTFSNIQSQYQKAKDLGYSFITCEEYYQVKLRKGALPKRCIVNRVDVDFSVKKTDRLVRIFNALDIRASFFIRLHAPEYNPFDFESYRILKNLIYSGHELGYHSEVIDQATIWEESPEICLERDIKVLNQIFDINITGVASHGGITGLNNLNFWEAHQPSQFGLHYEAYESSDTFDLFKEALYISDSEWIRWKCYDKGVKKELDVRSFSDHLDDQPDLIYLLVHPDTYFDIHMYE